MTAQREDYPIAKMLIKGHEDPLFLNGLLEYLPVIGSGLAYLRRPHHVISSGTQSLSHFHPKHLIEIDSRSFRHQSPLSLNDQ